MKQVFWLLLLCAMPLSAATYNLSSGSYPPCSTNWSVNGNTFRCNGNGRVTLNNGDIVVANAAATLIANNGFSLNGATIGSAATRINLQSDYGSINSTNTNFVWGNITASSAVVTLNSTAVNGSISSGGSINLSGGSVTGLVTSRNNTITTNGTDLSGGATARSGMSLTGGTLAGDFVMLSNNSMTLSGVTMQSGSISGASTVSINDSKLGSAGAMVNISSNSGAITLNNSTVYGVLQAPGYSTVNVQAGSQVFGQCLPNATPADACTLYEPLQQAGAHYPLDLCTAVNNGVIADLTGNYPASGINVGAVTDGQVLEAGGFSAAGNDYINVPAAALNGLSNFSLSMWFRPDAGAGFRELFSASSNSSNTELELYINGNNEIRAGLKGAYYTFSGGSSSPVVASNVWSQVTLTRNGNQLCLYLNNNLVRCVTASSSAGLSVARAAVGIWWQANGNLTDDFRGDIDEVLVFNQALSQLQISQMYQNQSAGLSYDGTARSSACGQCLTDNFSGTLSPDSWVTSRSSGNFTPQIVNGRLRMTEAVGNQATSATYQRLYPAADNLVIVEFDYRAYGGNGADGLALVLSDATITPQAGAFGGPLGYGFKPGISGFAGGWLGFGLDEYGNFSNEGGGTNVGRRQQSVAVRGSGEGTTGYRYLRGTCNNGNTNPNGNCLSPAVDGNQNSPHRYRFTVDSRQAGTTLVSVERDSGNGFVSLIAPFNAQNQTGQAPVPENFFLSLTGSTGGSNNIHELDNLSICALRSEPVGVLVDHFQLTHPTETVSCLAAPVEVKACLNNRCLDGADIYTDPVTVTLTANGNASWAGGNTVTLTNGVGTAYLRNSVIGANPDISIEAVSSEPAAKAFFRGRNRCINATSGNVTDCKINFVDTGLLFTEQDGESPLTHQTAGTGFSGVLRAIRTNTTTGACEARASGSKAVQIGFSCENPGSCIAGQQFSVNGSAIAANSAGTSNNRSDVNLTFDANGSAPLSMNYSDVGQLRLHASLTLPEQAADPAITLQTSSEAFVVRPYTLAVVQAMRQDGSANPGTTNGGDGFVAAGEPFNVVIEAQNASGAATPNFGREISRQLVEPVFNMLEYPAGGSDGVLAAGSTNLALPALNGRQTVTDVSWNEAGSIRLQAKLSNDSYLSVADISTKPVSDVIGRFYPSHFRLESSSVLNTCRLHADSNQHFSYMSEDKLTLDYQVLAVGVNASTLENYHSDTYAETAQMMMVAQNNANRLNANRLAIASAQWSKGVYAVEQTDATFNRAGSPDGPYENLQFGLQVLPGSEQDNRDFQLFTLGPDAVALDGVVNMRYGRLSMQNLAGPEDEPLPLVFATEYWDGSDFLLNAADSCTLISNSSALLTTISGSPDLSLIGNSGIVQLGRFPAQTLWLNPPSAVGTWQVQYETPPWLQYYWRGATPDYQQNPSAEVMFGRFRGNPRQISWRELFQ